MVRWISLRAAASTVIVACSLATGSIAAQAQHSDDLKSLNQQVVRLHSAAKYAEAADIAKLALVLAERKFSPGHPEVGTALNNLALLYHAQGRFAEAEPLYKRALAIDEKTLGPKHTNARQGERN